MDALVYWRFDEGPGAIHYVMLQIRADEMKRIRKKDPDAIGTPLYWALMDDGDVAWWPNSRQGEPVVHPLPQPRRPRLSWMD
jgi:hypothetical protein